eukprot:Opistho-2@25317
MLKTVRKVFGLPEDENQRGFQSSDARPLPDAEDEGGLNPFTEAQFLLGHTDIVRILVAIDESRFASGSDDGTAIIWSCVTGRRLHVLHGHSLPVTSMLVIGAGGRGRTVSGQATLPQPSTQPSTQQQGTPGATTSPLASGSALSAAAVANVTESVLVTAGSDKCICLWNVDRGECLRVLTEHAGSVKRLCLVREGMFCSGGKDLCLWTSRGTLVSKCSPPGDDLDIQCLLVLPQDKIITGSNSNDIAVYSAVRSLDAGLAFHKTLSAHRESVRTLANVSDSLFASGSIDGTIVLWSTSALVPVSTIPAPGAGAMPRARQSLSTPAGTTVASGAEAAPQPQQQQQPQQPKVYASAIQYIMVHAQRYLFAAIGANFAVYDVVLRDWVMRSAQAHRHQVLGMALALNGTRLVTCSADWTLRLWGPEGSADYSRTADPFAFGFPPQAPPSSSALPFATTLPSARDGSPAPPPDAWLPTALPIPGSVRPFVGPHPSTFQSAENSLSQAAGNAAPNNAPLNPATTAGGGPARPVCHGELLAHADVVNAVLPVGDGSFASCGSDGVVVLWKDGLAEARKRAELVRMIHGLIAASTRPMEPGAASHAAHIGSSAAKP